MTAACTICHRVPAGSVARSIRGELTCLEHQTVDRCACCARPGAPGESGWTRLDALSRCPTCGTDAVDTPERLRRHVREVRRVTQELGFGLAARVRVMFASPDGPLPRDGDGYAGQALGYTEIRATGPRNGEVKAIRVRRGLPAFMFGRVVAHEVGHAWLAQTGARPLDASVEEGVCELLSYAWLKRSDTPYAEAVRETIRSNPDPVYGDGFRAVHAAVRQHGLTSLVDALVTSGQLPAEAGRST